MSGPVEGLRQPVRVGVVARYTGQLAMVWAALMLVPMAVACGTGELAVGGLYAAGVAIVALLGWRASRARPPRELQSNEAMVIGAALFVLSPLATSLPFSAQGIPWIDAYFEAVSGVTTTGLSTLASVEHRSEAFLFARAFNQWVGGLGIVALALALVTHPGALARRLSLSESYQEGGLGSTRAHFRSVLTVYCAITLLGILVLWLVGAGAFQALLYALAAVSTGGFAPDDASLAAFAGSSVPYVVVALCFACAVPLWLYAQAVRGRPNPLWGDAQLRALLLAAVIVAALLTVSLAELSRVPLTEAAMHGSLMAMSAQSTAGFASLDVGALDGGSKLILIFAMAVGGGVGSTAGGIKILRVLILVRVLQATFARLRLPRHAVFEAQLGDRRIEPEEIQEAVTIVSLFIATILGSWLIFVLSGYEPLDSLFEVASATGTVGLSTGVTSAELPAGLKFVLCADMTLGRVEFVALLVMLSPMSWRLKERSAR